MTPLAFLYRIGMDDGTIIGDTLVVGKVLELIMEDGHRCGLHLNVDKTEVFWPKEDPRSRLAGVFPPNIAMPLHGAKLLGGPASVDSNFSSELVMKRVAKTIVLMEIISKINDPYKQEKLHSFYSSKSRQARVDKKETGGEQETAIDEKAENTAKGMIFQTLPQDMLMQVAQYTTANEVWNSIKVKHLGADLVQKARLQTLRSELETLKMKPHESTSEFAGKLSSIQAKFKSLGSTLKDKVLVRKLLNSVPKKFLPIVASIEQYQEIDTMQFEEAVGRITAFEERLKSQDEPENNYQDKLLMASSNNKSYGKWRGKDFNKETEESMKWKNNPNARRASTSQETKDKSKLRCYECGKHGHFAKECTKWKHNKYKQEESHLIYDTDTEPTLL
ncbi:zinc finger, CCHC-type containing protein [Tanacetum coccineum]